MNILLCNSCLNEWILLGQDRKMPDLLYRGLGFFEKNIAPSEVLRGFLEILWVSKKDIYIYIDINCDFLKST